MIENPSETVGLGNDYQRVLKIINIGKAKPIIKQGYNVLCNVDLVIIPLRTKNEIFKCDCEVLSKENVCNKCHGALKIISILNYVRLIAEL